MATSSPANMVKDLAIDGAAVAFKIELTTPACPLKDEIETRVHAALDADRRRGGRRSPGARRSGARRRGPAEQLRPGRQERHRRRLGQGRRRQEHRRVNLAVALAQAGAAVGLLDADITGPNIPLMLGLEGQPSASPRQQDRRRSSATA